MPGNLPDPDQKVRRWRRSYAIGQSMTCAESSDIMLGGVIMMRHVYQVRICQDFISH